MLACPGKEITRHSFAIAFPVALVTNLLRSRIRRALCSSAKDGFRPTGFVPGVTELIVCETEDVLLPIFSHKLQNYVTTEMNFCRYFPRAKTRLMLGQQVDTLGAFVS